MRTYGILIYDGVEPIDVGAAFGILSIAKRIVPDIVCIGVARDAGPVTCANGLVVMSDHGFETCPDLDDLVVTGGPGWVEAAQDEATLHFIQRHGRRRTSLCTGALILDAAGVLKGRKATTKTRVFEGEASPMGLLGPLVDRRAAALVEDDDLITSGGITLGLDAMFLLVERNHGTDVATETARVMEYDRARAANKATLGYA